MNVSGDWLTNAPTQAVCKMLTDAGYQALFVGGCVRNALLGAPVNDIDLSTDAAPDAVVQLAKQAGLKAVPTGIEHGTVTVIASHTPHEITTFRRDVATDGRRAVVAFSTDVADDARRRDFTMNALYARPDGSVIDPLGGLPDLLARRGRFIEDANQRLREDYLRALRFFRFHAWYGDAEQGLDADALAAIAANLDGLAQLSKERVTAEFEKLLCAPDPAPALAAMQHSGVLLACLGGGDIRTLGPLLQLETQMDLPLDPILRLAALGDVDVDTRLRLSKEDARFFHLFRAEAQDLAPPQVLAYRHDSLTAERIIALRAALLESPVPDGYQEQIERGARARFPVTARDLMPGYQGPELGLKLKELEARWIKADFAPTREDLLKG